MATYTMLIRDIARRAAQHESDEDWNMLSLDKQVEYGRKFIFDFDYPMHNKEYKPVFEEKFIRRNFFKEIGFETVAEFKMRLQSDLMLLLPKYNNLYKLEEERIDFFIGQLEKTEFERTSEGSGESDTKANTDIKTSNTSHSNTDTIGDSENYGATANCENTDVNTTGSGTSTDGTTTAAHKKDSPNNTVPLSSPNNASEQSYEDTNNKGTTSTKGTSSTSTGGKTASSDVNKSTGNTTSDSTDAGTSQTDQTSGTKSKNSALENYIQTRTNNNADNMLDRINQFVTEYKSPDEYVLADLDFLFMSVW